jgi:hypothetical protein
VIEDPQSPTRFREPGIKNAIESLFLPGFEEASGLAIDGLLNALSVNRKILFVNGADPCRLFQGRGVDIQSFL